MLALLRILRSPGLQNVKVFQRQEQPIFMAGIVTLGMQGAGGCQGALCLLSLAGVANAASNHFKVQGMVYCDTCRTQFITRVSHMMEGATVRLECRNITGGTETFKSEAVTDKLGMYTITVDGDYEDDICEIVLVKSPNHECTEIPTDMYAKQAAHVSLTSNSGEATDIRNANPLGFMRKHPLAECPEVLKELDLFDLPPGN